MSARSFEIVLNQSSICNYPKHIRHPITQPVIPPPSSTHHPKYHPPHHLASNTKPNISPPLTHKQESHTDQYPTPQPPHTQCCNVCNPCQHIRILTKITVIHIQHHYSRINSINNQISQNKPSTTIRSAKTKPSTTHPAICCCTYNLSILPNILGFIYFYKYQNPNDSFKTIVNIKTINTEIIRCLDHYGLNISHQYTLSSRQYHPNNYTMEYSARIILFKNNYTHVSLHIRAIYIN